MKLRDLTASSSGRLRMAVSVAATKEALQMTSTKRWPRRLRLSGFLALILSYVLVSAKRAKALREYYLWFRHVDGMVDRDHSSSSNIDLLEYLGNKRGLIIRLANNSKYSQHPCEPVDSLMVSFFRVCRELNIDPARDCLRIIRAFCFDAVRFQENMVPSRDQLDEYFNYLDLSMVRLTLSIMGEDGLRDFELRDLALLTRIRYSLRDLATDLSRGIINISLEEVEAYDIDIARCLKGGSFKELMQDEGFRRWHGDKVKEMSRLLAMVQGSILNRFGKNETRRILELAFINPARKALGQSRT